MNSNTSSGLRMAQEVYPTVCQKRKPRRIVALAKQGLPWLQSDTARRVPGAGLFKLIEELLC